MNWFSSSRGLAGSEPAGAGPARATHKERTEALRSAMLEALAGISAAPGARALMHRIHVAGDAVGLWYMRPEVMSMLASYHGEAVARQTLARLGIHFQGILPEGLASQLRPTGRTGTPASFPPA
ncbi:hypothetical protein [Ramlibacter sp. WS9]|uniref:hypothetical protein n=1 Tax=Ramlibacter sp. WS9 TaxID=1882741 RepID=UPI0011412534|nr:hypothetical protein [Ramlibacter sp. WS9]ROZ72048.1 hypothetical protein EEB15_19895 [Ramlibacter sp. WS9]